MAVLHHGGQVRVGGDLLFGQLLGRGHVAELRHQFGRGVHQHAALVAVDHHFLALQRREGQVHRTHHGGHAHGTREDRDVRVAGARHRDDAREARARHIGKRGGGDVLADQNAARGIARGLAHARLQLREHAPAEVTDIRAALADIGVFHQFEGAHVLEHHLTQRALRPVALADADHHLARERTVGEQHRVGIEEREFFRAHAPGEFLAGGGDLVLHAGHRVMKERDLLLRILAGALRHGLEIRGRRDDHHLPDADAGRPGDAEELPALRARAATQFAVAAHQPRVRDDRGELRRHGDEEGFLVFVETAALALLHHQHAQHFTVVDDRHAEEGAEQFFARALDELELRVGGGVLEVQRFLAAGHVAYEAFVPREAEAALQRLVQTLCGHEDVAAGGRVDEVDRADLGVHLLAHAAHDDGEGLGEIAGRGDFLHDAAQGFQHRAAASALRRHRAPAFHGAARARRVRGGRPRA